MFRAISSEFNGTLRGNKPVRALFVGLVWIVPVGWRSPSGRSYRYLVSGVSVEFWEINNRDSHRPRQTRLFSSLETTSCWLTSWRTFPRPFFHRLEKRVLVVANRTTVANSSRALAGSRSTALRPIPPHYLRWQHPRGAEGLNDDWLVVQPSSSLFCVISL